MAGKGERGVRESPSAFWDSNAVSQAAMDRAERSGGGGEKGEEEGSRESVIEHTDKAIANSQRRCSGSPLDCWTTLTMY